MNNNHFYQNKKCEYFPCHEIKQEEKFNCFFCYCPLYLIDDCLGNKKYTTTNIKDCSTCLFPHFEENYEKINNRLYDYIKEKNKKQLMNIKLAAIDLDHTILYSEFYTDNETIEIFEELKANNIITVICTARAYVEAMYFVDIFKPDYLIASNGAEIYEYKNKEEKLLQLNVIPKEITEEMINVLKSYPNIFFLLEEDRVLYYNYPKELTSYLNECEDFFFRTKQRVNEVGVKKINYINEFPNMIGTPRFYFMDFVGDDSLHEKFDKISEKYPKVNYVCSFNNGYELGVSDKGKGLSFILEYTKVNKENVIAFGDSLADIPMMEQAGVKVAVENGKDELKEKCDYICKDVHLHGVKEFLDINVFNKELVNE